LEPELQPEQGPDRDPHVVAGLRCMAAGEWFQAHEELELAWRPAQGERRRWLQALIHGAVALEHLQRGNPRGTLGQWHKCEGKLEGLPAVMGGLDVVGWREAWRAFAAAINLPERSRRHVARASPEGLPPLPPEAGWPLPRWADGVGAY